MAALSSHINDEQRAVLQTMYRAFLDSGDWPRYGWLDDELDAHDIDLNPALEAMPEGLYWPDWHPVGTVWYAEEAQLGLRVAGLALCEGSKLHLEMLLAVVKWLVKKREPTSRRTPQTIESLQARTADLIEPLKTVLNHEPLVSDLKLMLELMHVEPGLPSWSGNPDDVIMRTFEIERSVRRRFRTVETVPDLLEELRPAPRAPLVAVPDVLELQAEERTLAAPPPAAGDGVAASRAPKRKRKYWHEHGDRLGRWTLKTQLGHGGNAEVWRALDDESGEAVALKILHAEDTDEEAYARFRREVEVVRELAGAGARVLPIIDHSLPENLHEGPAWYAMPEATAIRDHLARASFIERVAAFAEIAEELAHLAKRSWHHRDLKPANLYFYRGRFCVGDYGLIKRPDDDDLTHPERTPGPYHYLPNEAVMRDEPIDPAAFDLQCLAKSLWVVLTDSHRPPQGQIPAGSYRSLSRKFSDEPRVDVLDEIIATATSDDPQERGTMAAFADRLSDWLGQRVPSAEIAAPTVRDTAPSSFESQRGARELERAVTDLLQARDEVGLRELLREERLRLDERVRKGVAEKYGTATYGDIAEFWRGTEPIFERVLATTLPLIRHASPHWDDQLRWFARFADTKMLESGLVIWIEMSSWCGWLFANTCGAYATAEENFAVVSTLLTPAGPTVAHGDVPLGLLWPGESGDAVGTGMMGELDNGRRYYVPYHEYTLRYLSQMEWLSERYGEFASSRESLERSFDDFNFLATLAAAKADQQLIATWTMRSMGAMELARRIRTSGSLRARVAAAVGTTAEELATSGNDLLQKAAAKPAGYNRSDASLSPGA